MGTGSATGLGFCAGVFKAAAAGGVATIGNGWLGAPLMEPPAIEQSQLKTVRTMHHTHERGSGPP